MLFQIAETTKPKYEKLNPDHITVTELHRNSMKTN